MQWPLEYEFRYIKLIKDQYIAADKAQPQLNICLGLIGLHSALLNDHHDFFLASQHPSAAVTLHVLAVKYNLHTRMWFRVEPLSLNELMCDV